MDEIYLQLYLTETTKNIGVMDAIQKDNNLVNTIKEEEKLFTFTPINSSSINTGGSEFVGTPSTEPVVILGGGSNDPRLTDFI